MSKRSKRKKREAKAKARSQMVADNHVDQTSNQHSQNQPGDPSTQPEEPGIFERLKWIFEIISIVAGLICAGYAQAFFSTGHIVWGLWFTFAGTVMAGLLIAFVVSHKFPHRFRLISAGSGWSPFGTMSQNRKALATRHPYKLFPDSNFNLTDLSIKSIGGWTDPSKEYLLEVTLFADDSSKVNATLKLICPIIPVPTPPEIVAPNAMYSYRTNWSK